MKVGIIAPISMVEQYCNGKVQYCLPRLVKENESYRRFYKTSPKNRTIILDCRTLEWRKEPENLDLCQEVYHDIKPKYVILPSYMFEKKKTLEIAGIAHSVFPSDASIIACVEGTTTEEVLECAKQMKHFGGYAIPSHLFNLCKEIPKSPLTIYIENHLRYDELKGLPGILVTSLPVRLGLQGRLLSDYLPSPPSLNFLETENAYPMIIETNIEELKETYDEV